MKKTLVIGASEKPERYGNKAIKMLLLYKHPILAIGAKEGMVDGVRIAKNKIEDITDLDTITLYLNPKRQKDYYTYILAQKPKRLIFNPGTENPELAFLAKNAGIEVINACTLVLLSTGQF